MIVVVTGIDGCGKTTIVEQVAELLRAKGDMVEVLSFPERSTSSGKAIEAYLALPKEKRDPVALQALFTVNRIEFLDTLTEHQGKRNKHLLLSRYWESGLVYGASEGVSEEWLLKTQMLTPCADLWVYLDITVEESFKRRPERRDHYESDAPFLEEVRSRYLDLFENPPMRVWAMSRWEVLDGSLSPEELTKKVVTYVEFT